MLILILSVRLALGSPVIFKQRRPGKYEKMFTIYKFRTMTDEHDKNGELLSDGDRVTKFGRFLRKTSLDELPELINIIKGDMSIIGPRPLLDKYLDFYSAGERKRCLVRPGLTGLAQINGRNILSWDKRFKYDVYYTENISFGLDLKIFLMTFVLVLKRENILTGSEHILQDLNIERSEKNEDLLHRQKL
jgi:lipopolysaccharide/colanic/teichoic acid biosynthesis glycosyltransferase